MTLCIEKYVSYLLFYFLRYIQYYNVYTAYHFSIDIAKSYQMFSSLRKGLIYQDVSPNIIDHDVDVDVDQWCYDGRDVYKGVLDPRYIKDKLNVYWLYDDDSIRVGLAEHEAESPEVFKTLWFYDNPFATLLQNPLWKPSGQTIWSLLSNEAYQDCLEDDFRTLEDRALNSGTLLVTPKMLMEKPVVFECQTCGKKSLTKSCQSALVSELDFSKYSLLFLDDSVIYEITTSQPGDASDQEPELEQAPPPADPHQPGHPVDHRHQRPVTPPADHPQQLASPPSERPQSSPSVKP